MIIVFTDTYIVMAKQQEKTVLMHFQKQANYRAKKQKEDAKKVTEQKAARKERDRLRYLNKKGIALERKQAKLRVTEKKLRKNKEAILLDLHNVEERQEMMEKQLTELNKGLWSSAANYLRKRIK